MLKVHQRGIKETDSDSFKEFEDMSKDDFEEIIDTLRQHFSLAESDLEWVENQYKKIFPPTTD